MGLIYTQIASGNGAGKGDGPLITVQNYLQTAEIAVQALTNPQSLRQYLNQAMLTAEAGLPEGAMVDLNIVGWSIPKVVTLPILGTIGGGNMAETVAAKINQLYAKHQITDPATGEIPQLWSNPKYPLAVGSNADNIVTLRWIKGQIWFFYIFIAIFALMGIAQVMNALGGSSWFSRYVVPALNPGGTPGTTPSGTPAPPFTVAGGMTTWQKIAIIGGGTLLIGGGVWYYGKLSLARAGAGHTAINIIEGRGGP